MSHGWQQGVGLGGWEYTGGGGAGAQVGADRHAGRDNGLGELGESSAGAWTGVLGAGAQRGGNGVLGRARVQFLTFRVCSALRSKSASRLMTKREGCFVLCVFSSIVKMEDSFLLQPPTDSTNGSWCHPASLLQSQCHPRVCIVIIARHPKGLCDPRCTRVIPWVPPPPQVFGSTCLLDPPPLPLPGLGRCCLPQADLTTLRFLGGALCFSSDLKLGLTPGTEFHRDLGIEFSPSA